MGDKIYLRKEVDFSMQFSSLERVTRISPIKRKSTLLKYKQIFLKIENFKFLSITMIESIVKIYYENRL